MNGRELVSPSEYARRKGLTKSAIQQAMASGRVPFVLRGARKMIDPIAADEVLDELTDHEQAARGRGNKTEKLRSLIDEKAKNEKVKGEILEIELAQMRGELIERDLAECEYGGLLAEIREGALNVAPRIAQAVHAAKNASECERIIDREIRAALRIAVEKNNKRALDS